ncbi:hypothetical protein [Microbacterium lacus]|uniref:hypothetical protein n=1 Tax=Microbacterium lacus TaxID=415217 RepID=UPI0018E1EAC8|nr:hypothetical protein [Microbacterium lacus]
MIEDARFVTRADALLTAITSIRLVGDVQHEQEIDTTRTAEGQLQFGVSPSGPSLSATTGASDANRTRPREQRTGRESPALNFADIARALRELAEVLGSRRIWLLLDEWSSVPRDLQPYLAEFLLRCVLPLQRFTVKIAAIEQQSHFREEIGGRLVGFELGADMGAHINLDDYLVYEGNEERSRDFFSALFARHVSAIEAERGSGVSFTSKSFIREAFVDTRAFDELVRAAEGVPRDALYIAARAGARAGQNPVSVPSIREAAKDWFQTDKSKPLESREQAHSLLNWIVEKVIRGKRARAFLVKETDSHNSLILALFDARVLHLVRRGYSAQDDPGVRYNVWSIDYGAYVDLLLTKNAPAGALAIGDSEDDYAPVDVPSQDLRAIRRAILDLSDFESAVGGRMF